MSVGASHAGAAEMRHDGRPVGQLHRASGFSYAVPDFRPAFATFRQATMEGLNLAIAPRTGTDGEVNVSFVQTITVADIHPTTRAIATYSHNVVRGILTCNNSLNEFHVIALVIGSETW